MIGRLRKYVTDIETLPGDAAAAWRSAGAAGVLTELGRRRVKVGRWMRSRYLPLAAPRPLNPGVTA